MRKFYEGEVVFNGGHINILKHKGNKLKKIHKLFVSSYALGKSQINKQILNGSSPPTLI